MARRNISTGIDIGSSSIRVLISEYTENKAQPIIIGTGISEAKGLRHGYIVNTDEAAYSIKEAITQAENNAGLKIKKAFVSIGGISVESEVTTGSAFVTRADNVVTDIDIKKATDSSEDNLSHASNKQIIHSIPIKFTLDGVTVLGKPQGMKGSRLEVTTLFVTCLKQHLQDFISAVEDTGIRVEDIMASSIAAGFVTLNKRQKTAGCVLANIGAETLSIAVFENNIPISLKIFPIGGMEITNDIALGLKITLDEAESIKRGSGINSYPKKKLEDIIEARLSDIFDLVNAHLKKIGKNGLLPAGIIITGGTSSIPIVEELAKNTLHIPSKVASPNFSKNTKNQINDSNWSVAYGLCIMGIGSEKGDGSAIKIPKNSKGAFIAWVKQYLP